LWTSFARRARAVDFKIFGWSRVDLLPDEIKAQLAHDNPVIIGLHASKAFQKLRAGEVYRTPDEHLGWHAVAIVGYDDTRQAFKLINSWGTGWADNGFGWIDYGLIATEASEAYVLHVSSPLNVLMDERATIKLDEQSGKTEVFISPSGVCEGGQKITTTTRIQSSVRPTLALSLRSPDLLGKPEVRTRFPSTGWNRRAFGDGEKLMPIASGSNDSD
jgi:hypothetical protein